MRVLVTGASSGIGEALARRLAADGARVAVAARRAERLEALATEIDGVALTADLARPGAAAELADRAVAALGGVDVLVNNAGTTLHGLQWEAGDSDGARTLFETNLWSPLALAARLVPPMAERGKGTVVNVTSLMQVSPFPRLGHVAATKSALALTTEVLRLELRGTGVRVIEAPLGVIRTPGSASNRELPGAAEWLDRGPVGTAEGAASRIAQAIARGRERVFYPRPLRAVYAVPALGRRYAERAAARARQSA
jgi:short-subunit dehydrogenase